MVTCFQSLASRTLMPFRWVPVPEALQPATQAACGSGRGHHAAPFLPGLSVLREKMGRAVALAGCFLAQVYNPSLPSAPALPLSIPPYAPVSQPTVQFILQGSLPLAGCGVAQSPAPVPTILTTASEPAGHATATNNSEERTATPRPAAEKTKNEEVSPAPASGWRAGRGRPHACLHP